MTKNRHDSKLRSRQKSKPLIPLYLLVGVSVLFFLLLFIAPSPRYTTGFETLSDILTDTTSKDELAPPESFKDHRRPSWKTYYNKTQPGFFGRKLTNLWAWLGLRKSPTWSPSYFKYLLENRIKYREEKSQSAKYEFVERVVPTAKSRFVVWGDTNGAYHSIVRGLEKLKKLGLIDEQLRLTSKDDYLLFTGDLNNRTPFAMELLTLVMKLEELNPDRIIYVAGNDERRGAWYTYGLLEEIERKAPHLTSKKAPLYKVVEKYFETLPLGVYASIPPHNTNDFVRFAHFAQETPSKETYRDFVEFLDDAYYSKELLKERQEGVNKIIKISKEHTVADETQVNVRALLKSYRKMKELRMSNHPGLELLAPDKNATAWFVLSNPIVLVHKFFNFFMDAFVIIQASSDVENWTITLYNRDMRKKDDFAMKQYNFLTGEAFGESVEPKAFMRKEKVKGSKKIRKIKK